MRTTTVPKIRVEEGEVWVCLGSCSTSSTFGIVTPGSLTERDREVARNEHKRMAYILDHIEEFADWIQWRGNPPEAGKMMEPAPHPWAFTPADDRDKSKKD